MKIIPINLLNHYKEPVTTLAQIVRLKLRDGTVMGFTSLDKDIILEEEPDVIYKAYSGMTSTAISSSNQFNVDNLDIEGFLDDERITESDLKSGRYDFADIGIYELNWKDLPYSKTKLNIKRTGKLGEIRIEGGKFIVEIRGLMQFLQNNIGKLFQTTCRAYLGDSTCKVNLTNFTKSGTVTAVSGNRVITCGITQPAGYFDFGKIIFKSGLNIYLPFEIKSWNATTKQIELQLPANYTIAVGDTFDAVAGCAGLIKPCQDIFENARNFDGEPYIPQTDSLINNA